jgi:hypothetical protein
VVQLQGTVKAALHSKVLLQCGHIFLAGATEFNTGINVIYKVKINE